MNRPPPSSTFFPSTPLSRSRPAQVRKTVARRAKAPVRPGAVRGQVPAIDPGGPLPLYDLVALPPECRAHRQVHGGPEPDLQRLGDVDRSEEHTSELQSRLHLVCRLLLEKKKRQIVRY